MEAAEFFKDLTFADLLKNYKRDDGTPETNPVAIQLLVLQFRDNGLMDEETADRLVKEGVEYMRMGGRL